MDNKSVGKKMMKYFKPFFNIYITPLRILTNKGVLFEKAVFRMLFEEFNKKSKFSWLRYSRIPHSRIPRNFFAENITPHKLDDVGIILQGPIRYEDDFTLETAKLYRYYYPKSVIVISTWKGVKDTFIKACNEINVFVKENEYPPFNGKYNINYQICSSFEGLKFLESHNCKFALKSRTDQRFINDNFLVYFRNLQKIFPVNNIKMAKNKLKDRIIIPGPSVKKFPFYIGDMYAFGTIDDLKFLYGSDYFLDKNALDFANLEALKKYEHKECADDYKDVTLIYRDVFATTFSSEHYLGYCLYSNIIGEADVEKDDLLDLYWSFLKNYCVVADREMLGWFWPKYDYESTVIFNKYEAGGLDFSSWLDIYLNYKPKNKL